jgi:hypothetical protein
MFSRSKKRLSAKMTARLVNALTMPTSLLSCGRSQKGDLGMNL